MTATDPGERVQSSEEFQWRRRATDGDQPGRRRGRRILVGIVVGAGLVAVLLAMTGSTSAHATFTADNVSLTSNAGQLVDLKISPEGHVHYDGLESAPDRVEVSIQVRDSGGSWETVDSKTLSASSREGKREFSFAAIDVLDNSSLKPPDFRANDGSSSATDVDVRASVVLVGGGPGGSNVTASSMDTMTITVTNQAATARTGGTANATARAV